MEVPPPPIPTPPPPSSPQKLRLMCSYNGHIVPRPHDKSLCYVGGETRIITIDRQTSLSELHRRLTRSLLLIPPQFSLKYQLPNEDLDSLISVSTDEDLENLLEEYDRLTNNNTKGNRIRLFVFSNSNNNVDLILNQSDSIKSGDWFLDALNCKSSVKSSVVSESNSSVNNLLGLDVVETQTVVKSGGEFGDLPNSPMLERTSSFGSTSSSPSTANLPPIKTRVEDTVMAGASGSGIEESFQQQMSLGRKGEEVLPVVVGGGEYVARAFSDDERSDQSGYRKVVVQQVQQQVQVQQQQPQFQQQIPQFQQIPSPDSVSSEGSVTNPLSRQRQAVYVDQNNTKNPNQPQVQETSYILSPQYDQNHPHLQQQQQQQQQFIHANAQYIPPGAIPMPSYYPLYPSQQQPMIYYPSTGPQTRTTPTSKPEMAGGVYRTSAPQLLQVPSNQHQAQYMNYTQFHHHPSQSMAPTPTTAVSPGYGYEMADPSLGQMYYTPMPPQMAAAQYQTMTSAAMLPDGSSQIPAESVRTLQQ